MPNRLCNNERYTSALGCCLIGSIEMATTKRKGMTILGRYYLTLYGTGHWQLGLGPDLTERNPGEAT